MMTHNDSSNVGCYDGVKAEIRINGLRIKFSQKYLQKIKRRIQYIKYCYRTLTFNSFREPTIDLILENLLVPLGQFSGNNLTPWLTSNFCLEKYLARASVLFIPVVHVMVLYTAYIYPVLNFIIFQS
jgi:hypothetical protein